jgi:hypothetical protein
MKRKASKKKFRSVKEMDSYLETHDLSEIFKGKGKVVHPLLKKINLDLPTPMIQQIDQIAGQIGIARQPLLKLWIHEKIREEYST